MEDLLLKLGNPGRFQTLICLLLCFNFFPLTFNNLCMAFYGAEADFLRCGQFNDSISSPPEYHINTSELYAEGDAGCWLFDAKRDQQRSQWCDIRDHCTACNQTSRFVTTDGDWSVVSEFDLMCDRAYLSTLSSSGFFIGAMLGGVFWGHMADRYGRFPVLVITLYLPVGIGLAIFLAESFLAFAVLRFVMGFCLQGLQISTVSLVLEYFNAKQRRFAIATLMLFWGVGVFGLATIAFLVRHWRWMQLVSSALTLLSVFYIWLIPESLRWLISKGKYDKARKLIQRIVKFNKLPRGLQNELNNCKLEQFAGERQTGYNISHLLRHRGALLRSCILWYLWLALALGYFGLALSTGTLHGSKYVNFYIGSAAEIGAYVLPFISPERFGRRRPLFLCLVVGGIACIVAGNVNDSTTKTALALVGRFGISGVYPVLWTFTPELYPTLLRTAGMGSCTFWAAVGGILAPQINLLGVITFPSLPITLFGIVSTIAAFLALLLPETRKRKIPDTLEEAKHMGWGCWGTKGKTNELMAIEIKPPHESKNFL